MPVALIPIENRIEKILYREGSIIIKIKKTNASPLSMIPGL